MATMSAARNLRIGESILGLANFEIGLAKWYVNLTLSFLISDSLGSTVES